DLFVGPQQGDSPMPEFHEILDRLPDRAAMVQKHGVGIERNLAVENDERQSASRVGITGSWESLGARRSKNPFELPALEQRQQLLLALPLVVGAGYEQRKAREPEMLLDSGHQCRQERVRQVRHHE